MLTQTNSDDLSDGVACTGPNTVPRDAQYLLENSFYRAFALADYGLTTGFHVKSVSFGVFSASGGATAGQPADIAIYSYAGEPGGTLDISKLSPLGTTAIQIRDTTTPMIIEAPLTVDVPATVSALVVELHVQDGRQPMYKLFVGINGRGERGPAYLRSPACGNTSPTPVGQVYPASALVLSIAGES